LELETPSSCATASCSTEAAPEIRPRGAIGNGSLATDVDDRGRMLGYVV
jgi:hypothetical protein